MTVPIRNVYTLKDMPKQCDICGEAKYGDCHTKHVRLRVVERMFACGRKATFYFKKEVNHWNVFYNLCNQATSVVEEYHAKELQETQREEQYNAEV